MEIDRKYVIDAIKAMHAVTEAIRNGTPAERGHAAARCFCAAIALEIRVEPQPAASVQ